MIYLELAAPMVRLEESCTIKAPILSRNIKSIDEWRRELRISWECDFLKMNNCIHQNVYNFLESNNN